LQPLLLRCSNLSAIWNTRHVVARVRHCASNLRVGRARRRLRSVVPGMRLVLSFPHGRPPAARHSGGPHTPVRTRLCPAYAPHSTWASFPLVPVRVGFRRHAPALRTPLARHAQQSVKRLIRVVRTVWAKIPRVRGLERRQRTRSGTGASFASSPSAAAASTFSWLRSSEASSLAISPRRRQRSASAGLQAAHAQGLLQLPCCAAGAAWLSRTRAVR
jgi:hypothetical protein